MICYDKRYLRTSRVNTIVEPHYDDNGEIAGYIYSDKTTYTDCVLLQSKFDNNLAPMVSQIVPSSKHMNVIKYYFDKAPQPFNMLAPYLGIISNIIDLEEDIEELTSRLFIISKSISFNGYIQTPKNLRVNIVFSASEFNRYKAEIDDYKKFMYESMKEESPSEVIYINTEEIARFGKFIELFKEIGIINNTQSNYSGTTYKEQVINNDELNMDYDPDNVNPEEVQKAIDSGVIPDIDFSALLSDEKEDNQEQVGVPITDDGDTSQEDEVDVLDLIQRGIDSNNDMSKF